LVEREEGYMQQHLCACMIDLAGEGLTTIARGVENPVPWPEILILQSIHGEQAIFDIKPVALGPRETQLREKERMMSIYGRDAVEAVYAGKGFAMEWFMPGWPIDPSKASRRQQRAQERPPRIQRHEPDEGSTDARI
jgi:hypothetical protein